VTGPFEEEEEGVGIASDGSLVMKPRDHNGSLMSV